MSKTTILIKPVSSSCNMICSYCFYDDVSNCRAVKNHGIMKEAVWKKLIDDAFELEGIDTINFAFQGGEPLMAGLRFFELFVDYAQKHKPSYNIEYSIQTNGTLLSDQYCQFFKTHHFLVGISIDGFKENHDLHRTFRGVGAFDDVYRGLNLLKTYDIPFNVLTVLTKNLAKYPEALYQFYQQENISFIQIVPCLASFNNTVEEDLFACTPQAFESFYLAFYKAWKEELDLGVYRSVLLFNDIVSVYTGRYPQQCGFLGKCMAQTVIESNGSVYPCDFYVLDAFDAGTVTNSSLKEITQSEVMVDFLTYDNVESSAICQKCPFQNICNGGCKRLRNSYLGNDFCALQSIYQKVYQDYHSILNALDHSIMIQ